MSRKRPAEDDGRCSLNNRICLKPPWYSMVRHREEGCPRVTSESHGDCHLEVPNPCNAPLDTSAQNQTSSIREDLPHCHLTFPQDSSLT